MMGEERWKNPRVLLATIYSLLHELHSERTQQQLPIRKMHPLIAKQGTWGGVEDTKSSNALQWVDVKITSYKDLLPLTISRCRVAEVALPAVAEQSGSAPKERSFLEGPPK